MSRITLTLAPIEKDALSILAEMELRDPRAQAALIIRMELVRRGLLHADQVTTPIAQDIKQSAGGMNVSY